MSILNPLNDLVAWIIVRLHAGLGTVFGPNSGWAWGLSIVILVLLIRLCLVPLFVKQVHAQRKMAQHAPHLQELRKKYKNDKQRLNEETMKFYKENGVNPLAGCLPMIPQLIIFFALFSVLRAIAAWNGKTALPYGLTKAVVESAQKAIIFGVHLGDKLLFRPAGMHLSLHVEIVIVLTVVVSATTTFMTVRQSAKRGLMQTNVDPDNPMAQSQKFMQYIVPFFSLTGLYWQYGLVLYWVTTNLWTLGQQYFMFRNWKTEDAQADGATAPATGQQARTTQSSARPAGSGTAARSAGTAARPASSGTGSKPVSAGTAAKPAPGGTSGTASKPAPGGTTRPAAGNGRTGSGTPRARTGPGSGGAGSGSGRVRTGSAAGDAAAAAPGPVNGENGAGKRSLLRLGRQKQEPEPEPEVPTTRVVRQQPVRQARSKRSGKR